MASIPELEDALLRLRIHFQSHTFPGCILFLCSCPDGTTFNLVLHEDGTLQLSRFILEDLPPGRAGTRRERAAPTGIVGFEVTDEDILNFYTIQSPDAVSAESIPGLLYGFLLFSARAQARLRRLLFTEAVFDTGRNTSESHGL